MCRATGESIFCYATADVSGHMSIPLELKLLAVLRMLGDETKLNLMTEASCALLWNRLLHAG